MKFSKAIDDYVERLSKYFKKINDKEILEQIEKESIEYYKLKGK